MPKPFRRATDGASKSPVMAEKHRASDRASASCDPTQRRGRAFFGYFLCATKKVTRATARNGSVKPKESGMQATLNPSGYLVKLLFRSRLLTLFNNMRRYRRTLPKLYAIVVLAFQSVF